MKDFLKKLNTKQYEAATTIDGPVLVIAIAGSGKTHLLVSRVANMIDEGINPEEILLLTFTNKAANEMKERIIKNIGEKAEKVTACTFHSFCTNFLRRHCYLVDLSPNFGILDSVDCLDAMSLAIQEFLEDKKGVYDLKDFPNKKTILSIYSTAINNCKSFKEIIAENNLVQYASEIETIIQYYIDYKITHNVLDYDDLLLHTKTILEDFEPVRKKMDARYKYISCDEYQDTNTIQDEILSLMSRDYCNLAVVGDDDQSIYKFRCANIENILTFEKRYPNCKIITLTENYRSSQEILDLSNTVMQYKKEGIPKTLHGQFSTQKPKLIVVDDNDAEANFIAKSVLQLVRQEKALKDIAVISRGASQSFKLEVVLNRFSIPYKKFGGIKFLEKAVVKDILAFLRLCVNNKDELAIYRLLQLYPGIGEKTAKKIAAETSIKGLDVLKTMYPKSKFHIYLEELLDVILKLDNLSVLDQLKYLIEDYYEKTVENTIKNSSKSSSTKIEELQNMKEQLEEAKALYQMANGYKATSKFLEDIVLDATKPTEAEDYLNLTTIHSAKGLEYDTVFLMDVIEGVTPKTQEHNPDDPEELRCMYVALTRAKNNLYLIVPKQYMFGGYRTEQSVLSHFINKNDILDTLETNVSSWQLNALRYNSNPWMSYSRWY